MSALFFFTKHNTPFFNNILQPQVSSSKVLDYNKMCIIYASVKQSQESITVQCDVIGKAVQMVEFLSPNQHTLHRWWQVVAKVSFFGQCNKMQKIPLKNFNIQTCFIQFLCFFSLKCWFKGQIISRIHLSLPSAYKLMCFGRNIN